MDLYDELRGLVAALEKQHVDYALDVKKLESRDAENAEPLVGETS